MARPLRIEFPGAIYHVVAHGNGRLWLFKNDSSVSIFFDMLEKYTRKYQVTIHNFVFMRSHFHLILETRLANLSIFMGQLLRDYAMHFNRSNRRKGSVFRNRYGAFLVQKDKYYRQLTKYVFYNPVKARITDNPYEYPWSSLRYIMHNDRSMKWFSHDVSLSLIGSREDLVDLIGNEAISAGIDVVYRQFIGDREWAEGFINDCRLNEEISGSSLMGRGYIAAEEVMTGVTGKYELTQVELLEGEDRLATMIAMYLMNTHTPMKLEEIGSLFNLKKFTVAQRLWRFKKEGLKSPAIEKALKSLETQLLSKRKM